MNSQTGSNGKYYNSVMCLHMLQRK